MAGKKPRKLKAEVRILHKAVMTNIDHLGGVIKIVASQKEQIAVLQASNTVIAESMLVITKSLPLSQVPRPDELQGYQ